MSAVSKCAVRVVSYNVLSSHLADPKRFTACRPADLKASRRRGAVQAKLAEECKAGSVICLQEVPLGWSGWMHADFQRAGYHFVTSLYGAHFSDYMGVGLAFPNDRFELVESHAARVGDTAQFRRKPQDKDAGVAGAAAAARWAFSYAAGVASAVASPLAALVRGKQQRGGGARPYESPYELAQKRHNRIVLVRLRDRESGVEFCVANYHMPCMFYNPPVMTIHAALAVQWVQRVAKRSGSYVLAGDFNFKPDSEMYRMVTTGGLDEGAETHPPVLAHEPWRPTAEPMVSAYAEATGAEPDFTNYAKINDDPPFIETLDYIFCSRAVGVRGVEPLPHRDSVAGPLPNADEPSDHILIAADLTMTAPAKKSRKQ